MGQSTLELPAETLISAIDNARRGVVTHITIKGERVAAIVSESTLAMSQLLTALLTSEMAASALPAVLPAASCRGLKLRAAAPIQRARHASW